MEEKLIVYGTSWCGSSRRARQLLDSHNIAYQWIDIDEDRVARSRVEEINHGNRSVPTLIFPDGSILVEPSDKVLAEKLGVPPPKSLF
ncbi:MAG: NrdH-redoxin [Leptolinea sp.]|jgi:mycoredoxin|nr:NrdH-redoxin [Leptolinea sp.]